MDLQQAVSQLERSYRRQELGRVVYLADRYLAHAGSSVPERPYLLFWKGMALLNTSPAWQGQAISSLREGLGAAGKDRVIKARIMAGLGKIYALNGDCASYEKLMKDYARVSAGNQPEVLKWGAHVWFNFGCCLDNAFRYTEAVEAYRTAIGLAEAHNVSRLFWASYHNLSGAYLEMGDLARAREAMARAEELLTDPADGQKTLSRRAEFALAEGDLSATQHWITETLMHPHVDDMTRADIHYTWARTLAMLGRPQEAYDKALQALEFAVKDVHLPGIHRINCFLQNIGGSLHL